MLRVPVLVMSMSLGACTPAEPVRSASGESCTKTADCATGLRCVELRCVSPSAEKPGAPADQVPDTVTLEIRTPDPAQIIDASDDAIYGVTNGDPIAVPRSDKPLKLKLVAEGFHPLEFEVIPSRDKAFEKTLLSLELADPFERTPDGPVKTAESGPQKQSPSLKDPFG